MNPITAEHYLLSAAMYSLDAAVEAAALLPDPQAMSDGRHRIIYAAILDLLARRMTPDYVLVKEILRSKQQLDLVTDDYLMNLPFVGSSAVSDYARLINDASVERHLYEAVEAARGIALDTTRTTEEKLQAVQQRIMDIAMQVGSRKEPQRIGSLIQQRVERLKQRKVIVGAPTGFRDLDELSGGLPATELIILASRPGVGKSSAAKSIARHVARHVGPVAFTSLEMNDEEIELRYSAEATGFDSTKIRRGLLRQQELAELEALAAAEADTPLFIDDSAVTVPDIRAAALKLQAQHGKLALLVVDYIQLVQLGATERSNKTRQQEIGQITRALKALARELRVPVLGLAQLGRKADEGDTRPRKEHLREAGDLENDANQIWLLHRTEAMGSMADLIVAKNRNGPTGDVRLYWHGATMTYRPASYRESSYDRD